MSNATATVSAPQAPVTATTATLERYLDVAARLLPWWKEATLEQQARVLADMVCFSPEGSDAEVYCEEPCDLAGHMEMTEESDIPAELLAVTTAFLTAKATTQPLSWQQMLSAGIPWYNTATPEQQEAVLADYRKCSGGVAGVSMAEYVKDAAEGWPTAEAYLKDAGWTPNPVIAATVDAVVTDGEVPAKASEVYVKYIGAVQCYAIATTKGQMDVGRWAQEYILAVTKGEADTGVRRSKRAQAVKRLDGELLDAGINPSDSDRCIRLYATASVFGKVDAKRLPVGKVRAFEQCLYRDKATEAWGMKDSVTEEQATAVRELWAKACAGVLDCNADVLRAEVSKALGKTVVEKAKDTPADDATPAETVEVAPKADAPTPAVVSKANTTIAERTPEVAPENPVECARRMASLPYGRPDSALVWRNLGCTVGMSDADAEAFVAGLADAGKLATMTALAKAAVQAVARLQAADKTVQAARTAAPVATHSAPIAVATGPGGTSGVSVVASAA